ncbi:hypothetical protein N8H09_06445 [Curtobacterium flaccumfaciens]|nr:hypothetical protein [Curtobacterium flaccumfaciens]MCU0114421.1 hypothetical protein [Curtobacterium flaccumfaciens]
MTAFVEAIVAGFVAVGVLGVLGVLGAAARASARASRLRLMLPSNRSTTTPSPAATTIDTRAATMGSCSTLDAASAIPIDTADHASPAIALIARNRR